MGQSLRQTALYKHSCPAGNLRCFSLQTTSTLMSLISFPEPPKYGTEESRAQGFSLSLIMLSLVCLFVFSCKIGIIISTISNSQDCVSVKQNDASSSTLQTTSVVLLCKCDYYDVGAIVMLVLWSIQHYFMSSFNWTTMCCDPSCLWVSSQAGGEESRLWGQTAWGLGQHLPSTL